MKKIAPTLRWHFDDPHFGSAIEDIRRQHPEMRAELRALLAVARAARHLSLYAPTERWVELSRAQASLDRASGGER
jgi:hypothetical protein